MNRLILVRHADAGERDRWSGPDILRPLSERGRQQAAAIVAALRPLRFHEVWSSPATRCVQTVEPLANSVGVAVTTDPHLLEGTDLQAAVLWLTDRVRSRSVVACAHGDLIPAFLDHVRAHGCRIPPDARWPKGSTWIVGLSESRWSEARFLPPPR